MTTEIDTILERRRLRRRLSTWRALAIAALVLALVLFGAAGDRMSEMFGNDQIARVAIEGTILESRPQLELIKRIGDSDNVKGVVIFVNSPGGTTTGGESLYEAIRALSAKKPVVAQFGTVAASAGYMVGIAADHIVSRANTVTGSVGVLIQWPEVSQMMDKIGVKMNAIKSGDLKAVPSPFEPLDPAGQQVTKSMIDEGFRWFLALVEKRRKIKPADVPGLAQGRVYLGEEALQLKLVDAIGGEEQALDWLQSAHNVDKSLKVVDWKPETASSFGLFSSLGSFVGGLVGQLPLGRAVLGDPNIATLGLDGLVSVWHPSEN